MENFNLLFRSLFTVLDFVGSLPVDNFFNLLEEYFVFSFNLDIAVLLDLYRFCM